VHLSRIAESARPGSVERVVFAGVHDSGRAQMAAAIFNLLAHPGRAAAVSAGTRPDERIQEEVVTAMKEIGVDLSRAVPRLLTSAVTARAALLVTMGCRDEVPYLLGLRTQEWPLGDTKGQPLERVREIRDEVARRVAQLVTARGWARP
jgi:arsenate reductase (thioredoxin)